MGELRPVEADHVIAFFPDYAAESPLWADGLDDPESFGLTPELCLELKAWARFFNDFVDLSQPSGWREGVDFSHFESDGDRLAQRVADELGSAWQVEVGSRLRPRIIRATHHGNPLVAAAAEARVLERRELDRRIEEAKKRGATTDLRASYERTTPPTS